MLGTGRQHPRDTSEVEAETKAKGTELSSHRDHLRIKQQHSAEDPVGRMTLQARFRLCPLILCMRTAVGRKRGAVGAQKGQEGDQGGPP